MKEVKLKFDVERIVQACQAIEPTDDLLKYSTPKDYTDLIDHIFDESIEIVNDADDRIESDANGNIVSDADDDKEKGLVLSIITNRAREYFAYNTYGESKIYNLYTSLQDKNPGKIREYSIDIINALTQPNTFIYNPQDGIHIQHSRDITQEDVYTGNKASALQPRTCTLKIDCASFSRLKRMLQLTTESMDREIFCRFSYLLFSEHSKNNPRNKNKDTNILKKYSPQKKNYSIDNLYTLQADDGTPLVDYGLMLMYSKYYKIKELCESVEKMEANSSKRELIFDKIGDALSEEELEIVTSIIDNIYEIKNEKNTQKGMIDAIEYMIDNNILLGEKDMPKILYINSDLSNFREDYLDSHKGLREKVSEEDSLNAEIKAKKADLDTEENVLAQAKREKTSKKEIEELQHSISKLNYEIYLLEDKVKKQTVQLSNVNFNMHFSDSMEPVQQKHILKKIQEVVLRKKIELKVKKVSKTRLTHRHLAYISIVLLVVLITLAVLFSGYIIDNKIKVGNN
ncbi:hypothetical protein NEMIN01_0685 [Nematocida minor]|uniref:uncharacterized protein n=1 Tax=Nematocida minor TaxID=1912983 RepID=UPI0022202AC9|nr:uncharacterized protein NEMIN01_0685 [Nematocida minor]KAI5189822.1 hypothetical protein NEMIN01_0685 [Nematocida minor]